MGPKSKGPPIPKRTVQDVEREYGEKESAASANAAIQAAKNQRLKLRCEALRRDIVQVRELLQYETVRCELESDVNAARQRELAEAIEKLQLQRRDDDVSSLQRHRKLEELAVHNSEQNSRLENLETDKATILRATRTDSSKVDDLYAMRKRLHAEYQECQPLWESLVEADACADAVVVQSASWRSLTNCGCVPARLGVIVSTKYAVGRSMSLNNQCISAVAAPGLVDVPCEEDVCSALISCLVDMYGFTVVGRVAPGCDSAWLSGGDASTTKGDVQREVFDLCWQFSANAGGAATRNFTNPRVVQALIVATKCRMDAQQGLMLVLPEVTGLGDEVIVATGSTLELDDSTPVCDAQAEVPLAQLHSVAIARAASCDTFMLVNAFCDDGASYALFASPLIAPLAWRLRDENAHALTAISEMLSALTRARCPPCGSNRRQSVGCRNEMAHVNLRTLMGGCTNWHAAPSTRYAATALRCALLACAAAACAAALLGQQLDRSAAKVEVVLHQARSSGPLFGKST